MVKFLNKDRHDGFILKDCNFIHEDGYVSPMIDNFHVDKGIYFNNMLRRRVGESFGVNKTPWHYSNQAIKVDSHYVGKSGD